MALTGEQKRLLAEPLNEKDVAQRDAGGGRKVSYIEGYFAIEQANRIFGFGAWGHTVDRLDARPVGAQTMYSAVVTVTVEGCAIHQDVGVGVALRDTADEHDKAIKTAVTDALKRALRCYGDQWGNALYDRDNEIHDRVKAAHSGQRPTRPAPPARRENARDVRGAVNLEMAARRLHDEVAALLKDDPDATARLPKTVDEMTPDELAKTKTWLQNRAKGGKA